MVPNEDALTALVAATCPVALWSTSFLTDLLAAHTITTGRLYSKNIAAAVDSATRENSTFTLTSYGGTSNDVTVTNGLNLI